MGFFQRRLRQGWSGQTSAPLPDHLGEVQPRGSPALGAGFDHADGQGEGARALGGAGAIADAPRDEPMAQCPFGLGVGQGQPGIRDVEIINLRRPTQNC